MVDKETMMQEPSHRPIGVTLIAALLALNGVIALIAAFGIFGPAPQGTMGVVIQFLFGLAMIYLAYGMWTLQGWAWLATLVIEGINALFAVFALVVAPTAISVWISLALAAVIILYLLQPSVRNAFSERRAGI